MIIIYWDVGTIIYKYYIKKSNEYNKKDILLWIIYLCHIYNIEYNTKINECDAYIMMLQMFVKHNIYNLWGEKSFVSYDDKQLKNNENNTQVGGLINSNHYSEYIKLW